MSTPPSLASSRRAARETALRILYMVEVGKGSLEEAQDETIATHELDNDSAAFARLLVSTVEEKRKELDASIAKHSEHYPINRQTVVDRNILRIATAEVLFGVSEAPSGVIANEAVELAKKYSSADSAKFVNGVLGGVIRSHNAITEATPDA
jgi:transcription antitermination protein NusB